MSCFCSLLDHFGLHWQQFGGKRGRREQQAQSERHSESAVPSQSAADATYNSWSHGWASTGLAPTSFDRYAYVLILL